MEVNTEETPITPKPEDSQDHKPAHRSRSRSSRSRSYSRSRSRSSSKSSSRSPHGYNSRSSSHNRSNSENDQKTSSNKKSSLEKEWKEYYSCLKRVQNLDKYISLSNNADSFSALEKGTGSERSHDAVASSETIEERGDSQEPETKRSDSLQVERLNSWSECDSDGEQVNRSDGAAPAKTQKQDVQSDKIPDIKMSTSTGWNSDSDSENVTTRTAAISEKEEGEASSESEDETLKKMTDASLAYKIAVAAAASSSSSVSDDSPEKVIEPEKHKSKKKAKRKHKHKRRSENKNSSHHGKDKAKKSKRKHQKLRETFHWQPPLESEEEEEEEAKRDRRSPAGVVKDDSGKEVSVTENPPKVEDRSQQRLKESGNKNAKHSEYSSSGANGGADLQKVKEQETLEDMDICTPEHDVDIIETPFTRDLYKNTSEVTLKSTSESSEPASRDGAFLQSRELPVSSTAASAAVGQKAETNRPAITFKWKPLKGTAALQNVKLPPAAVSNAKIHQSQTPNPHLVRMEIKSTSRVRPGSLFDEVRKTARLNQRPRNQESSSEERSPSVGKTRAVSPKTSGSLPRKSRSVSSHESHSRGWSRSSSRSRSRSRSYTYSSR